MKYAIKSNNTGKKENVELEDKDFALINALDNLTNEIKMLRLSNG